MQVALDTLSSANTARWFEPPRSLIANDVLSINVVTLGDTADFEWTSTAVCYAAIDQALTAAVSALAEATTANSIRPSWWDHAETRFAHLRSLNANWNSYGAHPLDEKTVDRTASLLATLVDDRTPEPSIVPAVSRGVQVEWHTLRGDLEIEFLPSGETAVLFTDASGQDIEPKEITQDILRVLIEQMTT